MFKILKRIQSFPVELLSEVRITGTVGMRESILPGRSNLTECVLLGGVQRGIITNFIQTPSSSNIPKKQSNDLTDNRELTSLNPILFRKFWNNASRDVLYNLHKNCIKNACYFLHYFLYMELASESYKKQYINFNPKIEN